MMIRRILELFHSPMKEKMPDKNPEPQQNESSEPRGIKVIKLAEGSILLEDREFLSKFPQEVQDQFAKLSWLDSAEALKYLAEDCAFKSDLKTAEEIVDQIKDSVSLRKDENRLYWGRTRGLVSLAVSEFKQGLPEQAQKRIEDLLEVISNQKDWDKEGHFVSLARFYLETKQTEKLKELVDLVKKNPNAAWQIIEPWAELELEQDNYESALALEEFLGYDTYKVELRVKVARKIGHQLPEKAAEILRGAEEIAIRDKRSPDSGIDGAWAFIGQPKDEGSISNIELAKHFFIAGDSEKADGLLKKAISETPKSVFGFDQLGPASIQLEIGKAYLLTDDSNHEKTKKHIYSAIQSLADVKYSGQYSEEMSYAKDDIYRRVENILMEIKDMEGLKKVLSVIDETPQHRVQLEIFALLLYRSQAD